jgi:peptidyl-prolyl cis-trans isomerase SurA
MVIAVVSAAAAGAALVDRIVAVVNDDVILLSEVEQSLKGIRVALEQEGYTASQRNQILAQQRERIVSQMIDDKLTDQQVRRYNLNVEDEEVERTIGRIRSANQITEDELIRQLEMTGISYSDYKRQIKEKLMRARLVNIEVRSKIVVTDSDVEAYYNANKAQYASSAKYDLRHILLRVRPEDDAERRMQIRQQMEAIHARLEKGEAFEQLARLYSNASTAAQGGRLGVFSDKSLTEQVRRALSGLKEKQFTSVLDTEQGYQVFYIEKIVRKGGKSFEEVKPEIQDKLYADIVDREFQTWLEKLRGRAHIQIIE